MHFPIAECLYMKFSQSDRQLICNFFRESEAFPLGRQYADYCLLSQLVVWGFKNYYYYYFFFLNF